MNDIDLVAQTFQATVFLEASWIDQRLKFRKSHDKDGNRYTDGVKPEFTPQQTEGLSGSNMSTKLLINQIDDETFFAPRLQVICGLRVALRAESVDSEGVCAAVCRAARDEQRRGLVQNIR